MNALMARRFIPWLETLEDRSVPSGNPWFEAINDPSLRLLAESRFADQVLDRGDMIAVFQQAAQDGTVTAVEFGDLQDLVGNAAGLGMPDHVRVLSSKVVNGDLANQWFQGQALGNLSADSAGLHLETLVDKWFYGTDRPLSPYTPYKYTLASGSLLVSGVSATDVRQGSVADCYFLIGLAQTAHQAPQAIEEMFIDNGDSTYTVRFYNQGVADYVTVDLYLPTDNRGKLVFAGYGDSVSGKGKSVTELWAPLAEKAYVQLAQSGWTRGVPTTTVGYNVIAYGRIANAFQQISGQAATSGIALADPDTIVQAFQAGQLVGFASSRTPPSSKIVPNHAYAMMGYDSATGKFDLYQPIVGRRSDGMISLTWNEILANFVYWDATITAVATAVGPDAGAARGEAAEPAWEAVALYFIQAADGAAMPTDAAWSAAHHATPPAALLPALTAVPAAAPAAPLAFAAAPLDLLFADLGAAFQLAQDSEWWG